MEATTPIVGERTAHLLNARQLLEQMQEEICEAYRDLGETEMQARLLDPQLQTGAEHIKDTLSRWIMERVEEWAASRPLQTEI